MRIHEHELAPGSSTNRINTCTVDVTQVTIHQTNLALAPSEDGSYHK